MTLKTKTPSKTERPMVLTEYPGGGNTPGKGFIGFWRSTSQPTLPDPKDFVDEGWDKREREAVADYLDKGAAGSGYRGWSTCRICGKSNGSIDRTDGVFVWPCGFGHYVREHAVKPPRAFVERCMRRGARRA